MPETEVVRSASPAESMSSTGSGNAPKGTPRRKQTPAPAPVSPVPPPLSSSSGAQRPDFFQVICLIKFVIENPYKLKIFFIGN